LVPLFDVELVLVIGGEAALVKSPHFRIVAQFAAQKVDASALEDLAHHGLHPGYYREVGTQVKRAFLRKLFAGDRGGRTRRRTAALILATTSQVEVEDVETMRQCWYTGLLPTGIPLVLKDADLAGHRQKWAMFQARQIQRTANRSPPAARSALVGRAAGTSRSWRTSSPRERLRVSSTCVG
jgi:hypothetical protein